MADTQKRESPWNENIVFLGYLRLPTGQISPFRDSLQDQRVPLGNVSWHPPLTINAVINLSIDSQIENTNLNSVQIYQNMSPHIFYSHFLLTVNILL